MKKKKVQLLSLSLDKEKIAKLSDNSMRSIKGGELNGSESGVTACTSHCGGGTSYSIFGCGETTKTSFGDTVSCENC